MLVVLSFRHPNSRLRPLYLPQRLSTLPCPWHFTMWFPTWNWSRTWKSITFKSSAPSPMSIARCLRTTQELWNLSGFPNFALTPSISMCATTTSASMSAVDSSRFSQLEPLTRLLTYWQRPSENDFVRHHIHLCSKWSLKLPKWGSFALFMVLWYLFYLFAILASLSGSGHWSDISSSPWHHTRMILVFLHWCCPCWNLL